jgi:hypothetical protein
MFGPDEENGVNIICEPLPSLGATMTQYESSCEEPPAGVHLNVGFKVPAVSTVMGV